VKEHGEIYVLLAPHPERPYPMDPAEGEKLNEMMWAVIDNWLKKGEMLEIESSPKEKS
jgi:hypothetical protein